jgi:hypothetical protein
MAADFSPDISHKLTGMTTGTERLTGRRHSIEDGLYRVYLELHVYGRHFRANSRRVSIRSAALSGCRLFAQAASHLRLVQGRILIGVGCRRRLLSILVLQIDQHGTASSPPRIVHRQSRSILLSRGRVAGEEGSKNWIRFIKDCDYAHDAG